MADGRNAAAYEIADAALAGLTDAVSDSGKQSGQRDHDQLMREMDEPPRVLPGLAEAAAKYPAPDIPEPGATGFADGGNEDRAVWGHADVGLPPTDTQPTLDELTREAQRLGLGYDPDPPEGR